MPRITNNMMTNTTLINIMRNQRKLDSIIRQIETTKRVQKPSDNPIVASRALKFRANVAASEQYLGNIRFGQAWQDVSEASLMDITKNIMPLLHELATYGANGSLQHADKLALVAQIRELAAQIGLDMNKDYAGRYAFSGLRTNEPALFIEDDPRSYVIKQEFDMRDIEKTKSFQKLSDTDPAIVHDINIIKLAYNNVDFNFAMTYKDENGVLTPVTSGLESPSPLTPPTVTPPTYEIETKSINDVDAYTPPAAGSGAVGDPHVVHYIKETGELVFTDAAAAAFKDGTTVSYYKEGFKKGELNPLVYFDVVPVGRVEAPDRVVTVNKLNTPPVDVNGRFIFSADVTITNNTVDPPVDAHYPNVSMVDPSTTGPTISINGGFPINIWGVPVAGTTHHAPADGRAEEWETVFRVTDNPIGTPNVEVHQIVKIVGTNYQVDYYAEQVPNVDPNDPNPNFNYAPITFDITHTINTSLAPVYGNNFNYSGSARGNLTLWPTGVANPDLGLTVSAGRSDSVVPPQVNVGGAPYPHPYPPVTTGTSYSVTWTGLTPRGPNGADDTVYATTFYGIKIPPSRPNLIPDPDRKYTMEDQYLYVECAAHTLLPVNTLAKDIYTDNMYADLKRLTEFAESLTLSDPGTLEKYYLAQGLNPAQATAAAEKQISDETAQLNAVLQDRFNNILYLLDRHGAQASKSHSAYGSLMFRFELMLNRTEEDEAAYTKLMSQNEDTDLEKAIMLKAVAEAAYAASLRASTNIINLTLANFLK